MNKTIAAILLVFTFSQAYPQNSEWISLTPMPTARYGMCSVIFKDKIWIIGGKDTNDSTLNTIECYNLWTDRWDTNVPPLQTPRFNAAAVVYHNKIYVIGGSDENGIALNSVEYFDPTITRNSQWQLDTNLLNKPRAALTAVVLNDTMYAIGGGFDGVDANYLGDIEYWNEKESLWEISSSWRLYQPRLSMATIVVNDTAYTLGGGFFGPVALVESYHPSIGTQLRSPMPIPRYNFAAAVIKDTIFVIGGATIGESTLNLISTMEKYDTKKDEWSLSYAERNSLDVARDGLTAVSFSNKIYIFGGRNSKGEPVDTAEMLDFEVETTDLNLIRETTPDKFQLLTNYPNPFNSFTIISFCLNQHTDGNIRLDIFNIQGQIIKSYQWNSILSGVHQVTWNGKNEANQDVTSSIYFYQLSVNGRIKSIRKMMLIR